MQMFLGLITTCGPSLAATSGDDETGDGGSGSAPSDGVPGDSADLAKAIQDILGHARDAEGRPSGSPESVPTYENPGHHDPSGVPTPTTRGRPFCRPMLRHSSQIASRSMESGGLRSVPGEMRPTIGTPIPAIMSGIGAGAPTESRSPAPRWGFRWIRSQLKFGEGKMKFSTDDDRFGIIITPAAGRHMFVFQLVMDGRVLGDREPSIIGSAVWQLGHLNTLNDPRLAPDSADPSAIMQLLLAEEHLHDSTTVSGAESLDSWLVHSYKYGEYAVFIARESSVRETPGEVLIIAIEATLYDALVAVSSSYWIKCDAPDGNLHRLADSEVQG
jgi:hypothetical protein